jgi:hypothetical protein
MRELRAAIAADAFATFAAAQLGAAAAPEGSIACPA